MDTYGKNTTTQQPKNVKGIRIQTINYIMETKNPVFSERLPGECRNNQEINDFSTPSGTTFHFCFCNKNMAIL